MLERTRLLSTLAAALLISPLAAPVFAQGNGPTLTGGQLIIEPVERNVVAAPDFKTTTLDGRPASLAGGYVGLLTDHTLLVGIGGYWLTNRSDDFKMGYGGLVLEWTVPAGSRIRFGAKGLLGVGTATLGTDISGPIEPVRFGAPPRSVSPFGSRRVVFHDEFLLAEPEAAVRFKLTRLVGLDVGAGYRFTGRAGPLDDRINGAIGSIALQIGGW